MVDAVIFQLEPVKKFNKHYPVLAKKKFILKLFPRLNIFIIIKTLNLRINATITFNNNIHSLEQAKKIKFA